MSVLQSRICGIAGRCRYFQNDCTILRLHHAKVLFRFAIVAVFVSSSILPAAARKNPARKPHPNKPNIETATRLQIFLDRANFSPGKLDGTYNEFTWKALALYREETYGGDGHQEILTTFTGELPAQKS